MWTVNVKGGQNEVNDTRTHERRHARTNAPSRGLLKYIDVHLMKDGAMFVWQSGQLFYWHLYMNAQMKNNKVDNFETLFCSLALMFVEMNGDEVLIDAFRFALGIQVSKTLTYLVPSICT